MFSRSTVALQRAVSRKGPTRRLLTKGLVLAPGIALHMRALSVDGPVRIGYAIARTGPWAAGAQESQEPDYILWAEQVNAAGGLNVKGKRRPIELLGLDDHSDIDTCTHSYEKLMGGDKVDLILAPWGSSANFALAPIANRYGYPMLAPTALSRKLVDMNLPYFFSLLQQPDKMMGALLDMLVAKGTRTVVVMYRQLGIRYRLRAEVDDMALLRLLARDSDNVALLPTVVVQDELRSGRLVEYAVVPDLYENFYAISVKRHFEPPLLKALLKQSEAVVLGSLLG